MVMTRNWLLVFGFWLLALRLPAQPVATITDFSGRNALEGNLVTGLTTDRRGLLWVSTWGGLYRYDGYQFLCYKVRPGDGNQLDNSRIDDVQQDIHGNLVCRSYEDYYLFDFSTNKFYRLAGAKGMKAGRQRLYNSGVFVRDGYRLRVTDHQLQWFCPDSRQWLPLVRHVKQARVTSAGVVWAIMDDGSFKRIIARRRFFELSETDENVLTLHRDRQGRIWQTNNDGSVLLRDGAGKKIGYVSLSGKVLSAKSVIGRIYAMDSDADGNVYLGSRDAGVYKLSPLGTAFSVTHYAHDAGDSYSLSDNEIFSVFCDGNRVWVGTLRGGLNLMVTEEGRTVFLHHRNRCKNFPGYEQLYGIRSMTKAGDVIALASSDGIFTFKDNVAAPETIRFYHSRRINDDPHSLASNGTLSVNYIEGRGLYVCSSHAGLCRVTSDRLLQDNLQFETWNTDAGAPSDRTLQAFADSDGQLWVIFEKGLSKLDTNSMTSVDYMTDSITHTWSSPVRFDNGMTCFATEQGLLTANLHGIRHQPAPSPILITSLAANGKPVPYSLNSDTIRLAKNQRNFTIEFAALDMEGTDLVEYAYQLEGRDRDWIKTGRHRTLSFFNLGAGTHQLLVKATDNNRTWSQQARRVTIIVQPTFWETPWAWLLYTVLGLLAVGLVLLVAMYVYRLRLNADFEKRLSEMKLRYFTNISHDLRTPLTLIDGPVSEMLHDQTLTDRNRGYLTLIRSNTRRMLTLVNQILDFRKIQNSKMHLLIERMDLKAELTEVMADFRYLANDHQIDFTLDDRTSEAAFIWGDRDKVQKIFFNLLSNAFKYTASGKRIWIELESDANSVAATVCDTGKGMPQHVVGKLFARFETILTDNYMKSSTGIGLSLVRELAELHHATLQVESKEGEGSRFKVIFQKGHEQFAGDENTRMMTGTERQIATETGNDVVQANPPQVDTVSIMVVEDDAEMLQFVSGVLQTDYQVLQATDGQDGLEKATDRQPDLIISDVNMPRMNGWQLVEALKQQSETSHIPIVLLTANSTLDDRIRGASQGVDDYIVKPFSTDYLRVRIAAILQKQQQQQQYYLSQFARSSMTATMLELPANNSGVERRLAQIDQDMMQQLRTYMEDHLADNTPIQELAEHVGMSRTLFYNKIRTITGLTPVDFYRRYHVERSAQLMRDQGLTVSEACYRTGFSDPKYFSKVFKKFLGVTPSEYRSGKDSSSIN